MRVTSLYLMVYLTFLVAPGSCLHKPPRFRVDLEAPPEERWGHVLHEYGIEKFRKEANQLVEKHFPKVLIPSLNLILAPLDEFLPEPFASEIKGIAKTANLGLGKAVGINIVYDFTAFCTSIVAQDSQGIIWHGRNLDYEPADLLKNLTVIIDYYKNGRIKYTATSFIGQVGVFTGMRPHNFTISLNERHKGSVQRNIAALIDALLLKKRTLTSFITRQVIASESDFAGAVETLSSVPLVSPAYLIVGGARPGEGVVITRDQTHSDLWKLNSTHGRWWLLETNYDHWTTPPPDDDRRDPGNEAMRRVGQDRINERTMFGVLSVKPVLNVKTTYTNLMCAAKPELYKAEIRD